MQCRICLDEGDALSLLTPCQCRGTASYIHRTCLDDYIRYYPDRVCRVCLHGFLDYESPKEFHYFVTLFTYLTIVLFLSTVPTLVKIALFCAASAVSFYLLHRGLFGSTPLIFVSILMLLFLPSPHPSAVHLWLLVIGGVGVVVTLSQLLPAILLLGVVAILLVTAYTGILIVAAYYALDPPAFTVLLSILYLVWYGWVREHLRLRQPRLRHR
jgi:hypothetical protein